ncbi:hypothetical protein RN22_20425 [Grimontia sp. AD028]|nr:hypothetical protein RN22_20425 [Grimontia sp. AD028]
MSVCGGECKVMAKREMAERTRLSVMLSFTAGFFPFNLNQLKAINSTECFPDASIAAMGIYHRHQ